MRIITLSNIATKVVKSTKQAGSDFGQITTDIMTNGCSGVPEFNMHDCCNTHDIEYRTKNKFTADWNLLACGWRRANSYEKMYKRTSTRFLSFVFYIGVTLFGWRPYIRARYFKK